MKKATLAVLTKGLGQVLCLLSLTRMRCLLSLLPCLFSNKPWVLENYLFKVRGILKMATFCMQSHALISVTVLSLRETAFFNYVPCSRKYFFRL